MALKEMAVIRLLLVFVLFASTVSAQTLAPFETVSRTKLETLLNLQRVGLLQPIEANGEPGKELLVFDTTLQAFTVAVVHPSKSGYMGLRHEPGVCTEPVFTLTTPPDERRGGAFVTVIDWSGDGIDDLILWNTSGMLAEIIKGRGVRYCS